MTEKQRKLEQLIAERKRLNRLIDDLSATADFEDDTFSCKITRTPDNTRISVNTSNSNSFPPTDMVFNGTVPNMIFNNYNYINIDLSTHVDNSVKSYSDTAVNTSIAMGDSAFQTISGLLSKLFD